MSDDSMLPIEVLPGAGDPPGPPAGSSTVPAKPPRKKRSASKMVVGVECSLREAMDRVHQQANAAQSAMSIAEDTTVLVIHGRAGTPKGCEALAEKLGLVGMVVCMTERKRFPASVKATWVKGGAA